MASYADLADYVNNLTRAAIDAHMRERFPWAVPIQVEDGFYRFCDTSTSPPFRMRVACPDASGNGGGESFFDDLGPLAEHPEMQPSTLQEYNQTAQFAYLRECVHEIVEGAPWRGGALAWTELPAPNGFDETINSLDNVIELLKVDETGNFIVQRVADIRNTLNRTDTSGVQLPGTMPMSGDFVQALRRVLTGDPSDEYDYTPHHAGQLITFCKAVHDYMVFLDTLLRAERGIWDSARQDVADVVYGAVDKFNSWQPFTSISLAQLVALLSLAGDLLSLTGVGAPIGALFNILADLGSVDDEFSKDHITMSDAAADCSSVEELLKKFEKSLNSLANEDGATASVNQGIFARECDISSLASHMVTHVSLASVITDTGNEPLLLQAVDTGQLSTVQSGDLDGLVAVANIIGQIVEELNSVVVSVSRVASLDARLAWYRPGGMGYIFFDAEHGPFEEWNDFAVVIKNLIGDAGVDSRPTIPVLNQYKKAIDDYRDKVEERDCHAAHDCERIREGW